MSPPIIPKVTIARWRTAQVIINLTLLNQSQRSRSSAAANDVSSAVCSIAKCGHDTCGHLAIITIAAVYGLCRCGLHCAFYLLFIDFHYDAFQPESDIWYIPSLSDIMMPYFVLHLASASSLPWWRLFFVTNVSLCCMLQLM